VPISVHLLLLLILLLLLLLLYLQLLHLLLLLILQLHLQLLHLRLLLILQLYLLLLQPLLLLLLVLHLDTCDLSKEDWSLFSSSHLKTSCLLPTSTPPPPPTSASLSDKTSSDTPPPSPPPTQEQKIGRNVREHPPPEFMKGDVILTYRITLLIGLSLRAGVGFNFCSFENDKGWLTQCWLGIRKSQKTRTWKQVARGS
jgi:hypothetical protein